MVFTFWEGTMPVYIKLCMATWKMPHVVLNYDTLRAYTDVTEDFIKSKLMKLTLPQIADWVRVHVLRDCGGYWLDADTIMVGDKLPEENIAGYVNQRTNTIGFLHTEAHSQMFRLWASYQDDVLAHNDLSQARKEWDVMGNRFTDPYVRQHKEIDIHPLDNCWPEVYMVPGNMARRSKYEQFYFVESRTLSEIHPTDLLMLHNSWTPDWYKRFMDEQAVLDNPCTLSKILKEVLP